MIICSGLLKEKMEAAFFQKKAAERSMRIRKWVLKVDLKICVTMMFSENFIENIPRNDLPRWARSPQSNSLN